MNGWSCCGNASAGSSRWRWLSSTGFRERWLTISADDAQRAAMTFFEKEVRPILVKRCYECHSNTKQKGGLRVDHIGYLKTGGDTGPAVVPGQPVEVAAHGGGALCERGLPDAAEEQRREDAGRGDRVLEKWIKMGAPWPEDASKKVVVTEGGFTEEQRNYWFFQPVAKVSPPDAGANGCAMMWTASSRRSRRR
jgi:hypothetical protein